MKKILREMGSLAGVILSTTVLLILVFFVLNQIAKRAPQPVSGIATFAESHANGSAYGSSAYPTNPMMSLAPLGVSFRNPAL